MCGLRARAVPVCERWKLGMTDLSRLEAEFLLCEAARGRTRVGVRFDSDTAWLSLVQIGQIVQDTKKRSGDVA